MRMEKKEFIETVSKLMDAYFVTFGGSGAVGGQSLTYSVPMILLEISRALNRIADEIGKRKKQE